MPDIIQLFKECTREVLKDYPEGVPQDHTDSVRDRIHAKMQSSHPALYRANFGE